MVDAVLRTSRPAMARIFLEAGAATRPVPRGAGIKRTETLPQVPLNFIGICVKNCEHKVVSTKKT